MVEETKVSNVENLGKAQAQVFDMGTKSERMFFGNSLLVHNSVFFPAEPLVKSRTDIDPSDEEAMTEAILEIVDEVQEFINNSYDRFASDHCFIPGNFSYELNGETKPHHFDIKQELIARSALWTVKKRYAQWIINDEGDPVDDLEGTKWEPEAEMPAGEHDVKGFPIIRSDFPPAFNENLEDVVYGILHFWTREKLDDAILEFQQEFYNRPLDEIAKPTGVNKIEKYSTGEIGKRKKGTPPHVKASLTYNDLIKYFELEGDVRPIRSGDKVKWVYLVNNPLGFQQAAFTGQEDPDQIMDFIREYAAYDKMYEKVLETKIQKVYDSMGWDMPSQGQDIFDEFFE
jgi:hypothetical protein